MLNLTLKPGHISLNELRQVSRSPVNLTLDSEPFRALKKVLKSSIASSQKIAPSMVSTPVSVFWQTLELHRKT